MPKTVKRCGWPGADELMIEYHDTDWGVPVHDDRKHFEYLVLDAFQAGLSWRTILHKRENFRKAFANFDYKKVAKFGDKEFERLMNDAGIVRNRQKIQATILNAKALMDVQKEFGSFDAYIWQFTKGKQLVSKIKSMSEIPAKTEVSDAMSKDLQKRGFKFVGSTICYAYMQAAGMVNDHAVDCFRHKECAKLAKA
ncbi:MAG: DNA-3-methyladenine glycosylase I [Calditrichaeota bacterium]|nr:DNA-3-methyladenine glycosylase I [Calditrichota bacterium]MCB9365608.1 DNA-3-methyladenine glycosylase I [Calditrichota bacterium]